LKTLYIKEIGDDKLQIGNIRFFCLGKEMSNDFYIYSYEIENEMVIAAMISRLAPKMD
jgi:hypothetical protein